MGKKQHLLRCVVSASKHDKLITIFLKWLARKSEKVSSKAKHNEMEVHCTVPLIECHW